MTLLHGGLEQSGYYGYQDPAPEETGYRAVLIDSHGRLAGAHSTNNRSPSELMVSDALAVMDTLHLKKAALAGWGDGTMPGLILAATVHHAQPAYFISPAGTRAA